MKTKVEGRLRVKRKVNEKGMVYYVTSMARGVYDPETKQTKVDENGKPVMEYAPLLVSFKKGLEELTEEVTNINVLDGYMSFVKTGENKEEIRWKVMVIDYEIYQPRHREAKEKVQTTNDFDELPF